VSEKTVKAPRRRTGIATPARWRTSRPQVKGAPDRDAVAERAYFIHLEEGVADPVANWLRAERELTK
jgi:hypothetical protein